MLPRPTIPTFTSRIDPKHNIRRARERLLWRHGPRLFVPWANPGTVTIFPAKGAGKMVAVPVCTSGEHGRAALTHLLAPHGVIEAPVGQQLGVAAELDDAPALQHVDAVGVEHRGEAVGDQAGDGIAAGGDVAYGLRDLLF